MVELQLREAPHHVGPRSRAVVARRSEGQVPHGEALHVAQRRGPQQGLVRQVQDSGPWQDTGTTPRIPGLYSYIIYFNKHVRNSEI